MKTQNQTFQGLILEGWSEILSLRLYGNSTMFEAPLWLLPLESPSLLTHAFVKMLSLQVPRVGKKGLLIHSDE